MTNSVKTKKQLLEDLDIAKSNVDSIKSNLKQIESIERETELKSYSHLVGKYFHDDILNRWFKIIVVKAFDRHYLYTDIIMVDSDSIYFSNNQHLDINTEYIEISSSEFEIILNNTFNNLCKQLK
jgi:hypothetical protein